MAVQAAHAVHAEVEAALAGDLTVVRAMEVLFESNLVLAVVAEPASVVLVSLGDKWAAIRAHVSLPDHQIITAVRDPLFTVFAE